MFTAADNYYPAVEFRDLEWGWLVLEPCEQTCMKYAKHQTNPFISFLYNVQRIGEILETGQPRAEPATRSNGGYSIKLETS